jgi:hypothetical protein
VTRGKRAKLNLAESSDSARPREVDPVFANSGEVGKGGVGYETPSMTPKTTDKSEAARRFGKLAIRGKIALDTP